MRSHMSTAFKCPRCNTFHPVTIGCPKGAEWENFWKNLQLEDKLTADAHEEAGIAYYKLKKEKGEL